jgi:hypothetical protein
MANLPEPPRKLADQTNTAAGPLRPCHLKLATALKCSSAYLLGESDDLATIAVSLDAQIPAADTVQRPDAVMALRIVDELLAGGNVEAARVAVRRALKAIAID